MPMTKRELDQFLRQPIIAVLATTARGGAPHAVPIWFEYRAGEIWFFMDPSSFKHRCIKHNPRVTLVVDTKKPPYRCAIVKGRARSEIRTAGAMIRRMSLAYYGKRDGKAFADSLKGTKLAVVHFKPSHIVTWDYARDTE
jgi:PPOX class probable F420-dependent enzyme